MGLKYTYITHNNQGWYFNAVNAESNILKRTVVQALPADSREKLNGTPLPGGIVSGPEGGTDVEEDEQVCVGCPEFLDHTHVLA